MTVPVLINDKQYKKPDWEMLENPLAASGRTVDDFQALIVRHYGPGPHPGTGTPQTVHGSGSPTASTIAQAELNLTKAQIERITEIADKHFNLISPSNAQNLLETRNYWMMPDGRITMRVDTHYYLYEAIKREMPELGLTDTRAVGDVDLFKHGFIRGLFVRPEHQRALQGSYDYNKLNFNFKEGALTDQTREAIRDVFWSAHYAGGEYVGPPEISVDMELENGGVKSFRFTRSTVPASNWFSTLDRFNSELGWKIDKSLATRHYGPGPHPGTGTPQTVHGGGKIVEKLPESFVDFVMFLDQSIETLVGRFAGQKVKHWREKVGRRDGRDIKVSKISDENGNVLTINWGSNVDKDGKRKLWLSYIRSNNPGTGLGTSWMNTMKWMADRYGMYIEVHFVTNPDFYRGLGWMQQKDWDTPPSGLAADMWQDARHWIYEPL